MNALPANPPHPLRLISRAVRAQGHKGAQTLAVESPSEITVNLADCTFSVRNELEVALKEIQPPSAMGLIRECVVCKAVFWAGRGDKEACDKHVERWRKKGNREKQKLRAGEVERQEAEARLKKTITKLSPTAHAVINAIMANQKRVFFNIDDSAASYLYGTVLHVPSRYIVRQTLTMLVNRGYLDYFEDVNHNQDRYFPRQKLIDLWAEMRWKPEDPDKPATSL